MMIPNEKFFLRKAEEGNIKVIKILARWYDKESGR